MAKLRHHAGDLLFTRGVKEEGRLTGDLLNTRDEEGG